jgi:hypothetical protein
MHLWDLSHRPGAPRARIGSLARLAFLVVAAWVGAASVAAAQPPDNADPSLAPWFQSLRQPGTGISCCSIADCRATEYRTNGDGYEALIDGAWLPVPADKVLHRIDNPIGRAVVCYMPGRGILCFVTPDEA